MMRNNPVFLDPNFAGGMLGASPRGSVNLGGGFSFQHKRHLAQVDIGADFMDFQMSGTGIGRKAMHGLEHANASLRQAIAFAAQKQASRAGFGMHSLMVSGKAQSGFQSSMNSGFPGQSMLPFGTGSFRGRGLHTSANLKARQLALQYYQKRDPRFGRLSGTAQGIDRGFGAVATGRRRMSMRGRPSGKVMQHVAARLNSVKLGSDLDEATLGVGQLRQVKKRARGKLAFRGFNSKKKTASDLEIAPTRTLRQSKKDAFDLMAPVSMLQDWNSAHDRLQALQSRKRRESVSIEVPANVSMLKRFMVDVVQDESEVLGDGAGKGSDAAAERRKSRLLRKSQANIAEWLALPEQPTATVSSSSSESSCEEGIEVRRKRLGIWHVDDEVWFGTNPQQHSIKMLRNCRDQLVQRFGGIEKSFVKCTSPVVGMTAEVFEEIVSLMGFSKEEAASMFSLLHSL